MPVFNKTPPNKQSAKSKRSWADIMKSLKRRTFQNCRDFFCGPLRFFDLVMECLKRIGLNTTRFGWCIWVSYPLILCPPLREQLQTLANAISPERGDLQHRAVQYLVYFIEGNFDVRFVLCKPCEIAWYLSNSFGRHFEFETTSNMHIVEEHGSDVHTIYVSCSKVRRGTEA